MKLKIPGLPGFSKPSTNGNVTVPASAGQYARISDHAAALREARLYKAVSKASAIPILALAAATFVLASRPPQFIVVDQAPSGMIHVVGDAQTSVTPSDIAVAASLETFIRDLRSIPVSVPGRGYDLSDQQTADAHRVFTAPNSPADKAELAFWKQFNPKARGRDTSRTVADRNPSPTCSRDAGTLTFECVWGEKTVTRDGSTTVAKLGSITLASEPSLSTDYGKALINPGGVQIYAFSPSLVED